MMNPVEIIRKKRDGNPLTPEELKFIIKGYLSGEVPEYQVAALLMAVYFRGMTADEMLEFTNLMLTSGSVIDLSQIPAMKVDKHSTGGVGDKISLPLAPIVAACGVPVPMISGRGLGHTGGTLDKLESIPGFRTNLSVKEFSSALESVGVVMIGQTEKIAPADRKMYALRDVTGTIECIPLIAGSIMSKKLAAGINALVLDVKHGRGAFMQSYDRAVELASTLVSIGERFGTPTVGYLTDMNQPLGFAIGNWSEIVESVDCLRGRDIADVMTVTYVLGGTMLMLGKKASTVQEGMDLCRAAVASGAAYEKFLEMVRRQGGDVSFIEKPDSYPHSKYTAEVKAPASGVIGAIDPLELGFTAISLGAGRTKVEDPIDPKAGITLSKKIGDPVAAGEVLAVLMTDKKNVVAPAAARIQNAISIVPTAPVRLPLITSVIDKDGARDFHP